MSGGSGGGGGFVPTTPIGGGGRKPGSNDPCEIQITLPLSAVQPQNAAKISVGEILHVGIHTQRGVETVVAVDPKNQSIVGAIAYRDVQTLIDCIKEGNEYTAKVLHQATTSVKVQVKRK